MHVDTTDLLIFDLPPYFFFATTGFAVAICTFMILLLYRDIDIRSQTLRLLVSLPFLVVGAKLVGIISTLIYNLNQGIPITAELFSSSGIVFYGGFLALIAAFSLFGKVPKLRNRSSYDALAVVIPLFHTFGRLGCFHSGCCYGMSLDGFLSVEYTNIVQGVAVTAPRVPIQLFEAAGNTVLFLVLLFLYIRKRSHLLFVYTISYAVLRFTLEFFRGDEIRGLIAGVSTSQIISVILFFVAIILKMKKEKCKDDHFGEVY